MNTVIADSPHPQEYIFLIKSISTRKIIGSRKIATKGKMPKIQRGSRACSTANMKEATIIVAAIMYIPVKISALQYSDFPDLNNFLESPQRTKKVAMAIKPISMLILVMNSIIMVEKDSLSCINFLFLMIFLNFINSISILKSRIP